LVLNILYISGEPMHVSYHY